VAMGTAQYSCVPSQPDHAEELSCIDAVCSRSGSAGWSASLFTGAVTSPRHVTLSLLVTDCVGAKPSHEHSSDSGALSPPTSGVAPRQRQHSGHQKNPAVDLRHQARCTDAPSVGHLNGSGTGGTQELRNQAGASISSRDLACNAGSRMQGSTHSSDDSLSVGSSLQGSTRTQHSEEADLYGARVVGFACALVVAGEMQLENMAVLPEYQGRGLGRMLLDAIFKVRGDAMWVWVSSSVSLTRRLIIFKGGLTHCTHDSAPKKRCEAKTSPLWPG
jgi:hypothetical protein